MGLPKFVLQILLDVFHAFHVLANAIPVARNLIMAQVDPILTLLREESPQMGMRESSRSRPNRIGIES